MNVTFQEGNAIRFSSKFFDWENRAVDPVLVKFILYDARYNKLHEQSIGQENRTDVGCYFYDFVPPNTGTFYYEFYGEINGLPSLKRTAINILKV